MKLGSKSTQNVSHDNDQGKKESRSVALERASERPILDIFTGNVTFVPGCCD